MNRMTIFLVVVTVILLPFTMALSSDGYDLAWWTVDSGGSHYSAGSYTLDGTAGQPDAGMLTGGSYSLTGGFWGAAQPGWLVYLPFAVRNP